MSYLNRPSLVLLMSLTGLCPHVSCQSENRYHVSTGWVLSEQQKPVALFRASEDQLAKGVFDPRADSLLRAAETFTRAIFIFPGVAFQKAVTYKNGSVDIMLAEWNVEGPSVKGSVILKDTPIHSIYEFRLS